MAFIAQVAANVCTLKTAHKETAEEVVIKPVRTMQKGSVVLFSRIPRLAEPA
jgi:hypothetical protein